MLALLNFCNWAQIFPRLQTVVTKNVELKRSGRRHVVFDADNSTCMDFAHVAQRLFDCPIIQMGRIMAAEAADWKNDEKLKDDLDRYVKQNLKRKEILDFVQKDFPEYSWSFRTLDRRLRYFNMHYIDYETPLAAVGAAVEQELNGPGKLLGYRALNHKLRTEHNIKVPRHLVYDMLTEMDPEGLEGRSVEKKTRKKKQPFESDGPLWVVSLDGHDKLCGYQNWTFPLGIYGCLDTFSRKILFLFVCHSNSSPLVIGKKYLEYLCQTHKMPRFMRIDRGTETGKMATTHVYLMNKMGIMEDPVDSVIYGPSTSNKIERWWRDLHERLEQYFKVQLAQLLASRAYDPHSEHDRQLLAYAFTPIIQRECDVFVNNWNTHRIRAQANVLLPTGVPNHMFLFPENYGGSHFGIPVSREQLQEVAEVSGLLECIRDCISPQLRRECEHLIPDPSTIESCKAKLAYLFLKRSVNENVA